MSSLKTLTENPRLTRGRLGLTKVVHSMVLLRRFRALEAGDRPPRMEFRDRCREYRAVDSNRLKNLGLALPVS